MTKKEKKDANYMTKTVVLNEKGTIDYDPDAMKDVVGGDNLSYHEYIEIQKGSEGKTRGSFALCYYEIPLCFKGQIERRTRDKICFKRIYVEGMYFDGEGFEGKEDHVWMDLKGFEKFNQGDSVSFGAEVYRYLKTGNGKIIDFGLRNPQNIKKIESYELPSDDDLLKQELEQMVCETCFLHDNCYGICLLPKGQREAKIAAMLELIKANEGGK